MHNDKKIVWFGVGGIVLFISVFFLSLSLGTETFSISNIMETLLQYDATKESHQIIFDVRLPRVISAALIGAFLSVSGWIMQRLTRNPLADPYLLGISHGTALALVLCLIFFPAATFFQTFLGGMVGGALTVTLIFLIVFFSKGGENTVKLALAGVTFTMFLSSITSMLSLYFNVSKNMSFWYAGSLSVVTWEMVILLIGAGLIGMIGVISIYRGLSVLHLGEEVTIGLGIRVNRLRIIGGTVVFILTGAAVVVGGVIGFVGLIVPHISRLIVGERGAWQLPLTALIGSILLMAADLIGKLVNQPYETPVGVVTALIGVPVFLYLIQRKGGTST